MRLYAAKKAVTDEFIAALGQPPAALITASDVESESDTHNPVDNSVVQLYAQAQPLVQVPALSFVEGSCFGIEKKPIVRRVDLNISRAQTRQLFDLVTQDFNDVGQEAIERRVSSARVLPGPEIGPQTGAGKRNLRNARGLVFEIQKLIYGEIPIAYEFADRAKGRGSRFSINALLVVPLAPKKGIKVKLSEAAYGCGHLALKGLTAQLSVRDDFEADTFLKRNRFIDRAIFDFFEVSGRDSASGKLLLRSEQLRGPKQATDYVSMESNHIS